MMIVSINHVQITVPTGLESQARAFYMGVLGLIEIEKPERLRKRGGFWLAAGDVQLHVGVEDGVDRLASKAHVAFGVKDLKKMRALLTGQNIVVEDGIPIPGYDRFECRDPFGNRLEFMAAII